MGAMITTLCRQMRTTQVSTTVPRAARLSMEPLSVAVPRTAPSGTARPGRP
jgi:hypothetical protein